jgi:hypothetical protein
MSYSLCQKCGNQLDIPAPNLTEAFHESCLEEIKSQNIPQGPHCQNNCLIKGDPYECWQHEYSEQIFQVKCVNCNKHPIITISAAEVSLEGFYQLPIDYPCPICHKPYGIIKEKQSNLEVWL